VGKKYQKDTHIVLSVVQVKNQNLTGEGTFQHVLIVVKESQHIVQKDVENVGTNTQSTKNNFLWPI
jgi:hypothetical protein